MKNLLLKFAYVFLLIVIIYVSRVLSVFFHEWSHSFLAWIYGLNPHPFAVYFDDWTLLDIYAVDTGSFYKDLFDQGHFKTAGLIAIVGIFTNFIFTIVGLGVLSSKALIHKHKWTILFLFCLTLNNLGQIYSYIPIRVFSKTGDVGYFLRAFSISPWTLIILTAPFIFSSLYLLSIYLERILNEFKIKRPWERGAMLALCLLLFFGWYGLPALYYYGPHDIRSLTFPLSLLAGFISYWYISKFRSDVL